jgi:hypothetical protein
MSKDKYYFTIKAVPSNITISRKEKKAAAEAFRSYQEVGKDVEWLGKWDGEKFTDTAIPKVTA